MTKTLSELLLDTRQEPRYREAVEAAKDRYRRARTVRCPFGNCSIMLDPDTGKNMGGFGPMGCACDNLPGWDKPFVEQMSKPRAAVKAIGRNGSRVQRSKRRHQDVTSDGIMVWAARLMEGLDD